MRKFVVIAIVVAVVGGAAAYLGVFSRGGEAASGSQAGGPGGAPGQAGQQDQGVHRAMMMPDAAGAAP